MIEEKIAYHADKGEIVPTRDMLKTIPQIEGIQKSADLNTAVLDHVAAHIHAGMSTAEIDKKLTKFIFYQELEKWVDAPGGASQVHKL